MGKSFFDPFNTDASGNVNAVSTLSAQADLGLLGKDLLQLFGLLDRLHLNDETLLLDAVKLPARKLRKKSSRLQTGKLLLPGYGTGDLPAPQGIGQQRARALAAK